MKANKTAAARIAPQLADIAKRLRKVAKEVRAANPYEKVAFKKLDPQHVLNFLRFFGGNHA